MIRQRYVEQVTLNAAGDGQIEITARGDYLVNHASVRVLPLAGADFSVLIPTAITYVNGTLLEGSETGNLDTSDTQHLLVSGDTLTVVWTGGDAGASATYTVRGVEYPAGTGMAEVYGKKAAG